MTTPYSEERAKDEERLDVERLARAIENVGLTEEDDMNMEPRLVRRPVRAHQAPDIAREYERLSKDES